MTTNTMETSFAADLLPTGLTPHDRAAIQQGRWFRALPALAQQAMLAHGRLRCLLAGETLARHGVAHDDWFAVCRGSVRLSGVFASGKAFTLGYLRPGEWHGQLSAADDMPEMTEAVAQTDSTVLVIRRDAMKTLVSQHPALLEALLRMSYARLAEMMRFVEELQTLPLPVRLARKIVSLTQRDNAPCVTMLRLTQQDWADLLGASRPRINAHLRQMERDGVIRLEHRALWILDAERLRELGELEPPRVHLRAA